MSELEHCRLAYQGNLDGLKEKIETNNVEDLVHKKDQSGRTALHWACVGGKKEIVDFLIENYKLDLDDEDETGWTPLMISSSIGSLPLVKLFLERKCDPNKPNINQQRPLHYACSKNYPAIVKELIENGADCNLADRYGHTPLHRAASKGNLKIIEMLCGEFKASINKADIEGNTPLHFACEEERIEACKVLLKYGANPDYKNKEEKTPIDVSNGGLSNLIK
ncbi:unnamed protein product [Brachionus calyciflorus]|uniref:26S proteasome non-ATPase regulatory subunit 10 n=1 Tax=Brachionus calyciflorus TaxID=104777 RepID=A0A813SS90_9BILA|nr:unnamed protein product [Brachionus calyciflorus]